MRKITKADMQRVWQNCPEQKLSLINTWIRLNYVQLQGSTIFTRNDKLTSKVVSKVEAVKCPDKEFIPSHTGAFFQYGSDIYCFDMKPPRAKITLLAEYLTNTEDDFVILLRDYELDLRIWNVDYKKKIGTFYPYISAVLSAFVKWQSPKFNHCSELVLRELQKQGLYTDFHPEITPDELYHVMNKNSYILV